MSFVDFSQFLLILCLLWTSLALDGDFLEAEVGDEPAGVDGLDVPVGEEDIGGPPAVMANIGPPAAVAVPTGRVAAMELGAALLAVPVDGVHEEVDLRGLRHHGGVMVPDGPVAGAVLPALPRSLAPVLGLAVAGDAVGTAVAIVVPLAVVEAPGRPIDGIERTLQKGLGALGGLGDVLVRPEPVGPPRSTNFSLWKLTLPLPPLPDLILIVTLSVFIIFLFAYIF